MIYSRKPILVTAGLPLMASFAVLNFAGVSRITWLTHVLLICAACFLISTGKLLDPWIRVTKPAHVILSVTVACLASTLLAEGPGPQRWISIGSFNLYMAPLLLPSLIAACSKFFQSDNLSQSLPVSALLCTSVILAIQPDASQALALLVGLLVLFFGNNILTPVSFSALIVAALTTGLAFGSPDPLQPVPHVEEVFALALNQSLLAGLLIVLSAVIFVTSLFALSFKGPRWLAPIGAYYTVLFGCSVAGLTPAPLIGFGAGPLLGFGLLVTVAPWMEAEASPNKCEWQSEKREKGSGENGT